MAHLRCIFYSRRLHENLRASAAASQKDEAESVQSASEFNRAYKTQMYAQNAAKKKAIKEDSPVC